MKSLLKTLMMMICVTMVFQGCGDDDDSSTGPGTSVTAPSSYQFLSRFEDGVSSVDNFRDWLLVSHLQIGGEPWAEILISQDFDFGTVEIAKARGYKCGRCWHYKEDVGLNNENPNFPYEAVGYTTGSFNPEGYNIGNELLGVATHSDFNTYITNIGLYNDQNELLAVAKPSKPIKNEKELSISFIVKIDTN